MATPWISSIKEITLSKDSKHASSNVPVSAGFTPPALVDPLKCGPAATFAAIAKMQALRTANPAIVAALERSAAALTEAIVDEAGNRFDLAPEADMLESTIRGALSGGVGAGICHLYMVALGYVWHDFAANVISTSGKLADFVYEGGPASGHGIVLAEAKGSFSPKVDASYVERLADAAYTKQVNGHIGASAKSKSSKVIHGYAVAFGAQPEAIRRTQNPPHAMVHVAQTGAAASARSAEGAPSATWVPNATLVLGNYRAAFMLACAPLVVQIIDRVRDGALLSAPFSTVEGEQRFFLAYADGREFLVGYPRGHPNELAYREFADAHFGVFAVEATVARPFLKRLSELLRQVQTDPGRLFDLPPIELPVVEFRLALESVSEFVVFPDGFSLLRTVDRKRQVRWSPHRGSLD